MSDANHAVHSAPWTVSSTRPSSTPFAVQSALDLYLTSGAISMHKINLGISLYGRAFYNNIGPGHSFGILENDWLPHLFPKKTLPLPGAQEHWDSDAHASYSYDGVKRMMVSYENRRSLSYKIEQAIQNNHVGGLAFWDVTADGADEKSLLACVSFSKSHSNRQTWKILTHAQRQSIFWVVRIWRV